MRRTWLSKGYRIVWRKEYDGVKLPPRFFASVRLVLPDGREIWDLIERRHLKKGGVITSQKTFEKAVAACEQHYELWSQVLEVKGIRALRELFNDHLPLGIPTWIYPKLNLRIVEILNSVATVAKQNEDEEWNTQSPTDTTQESVVQPAPRLRKQSKNRGRGRPRKDNTKLPTDQINAPSQPVETNSIPKRGRGRPRKSEKQMKIPPTTKQKTAHVASQNPSVKRGRGRPKGSKNK